MIKISMNSGFRLKCGFMQKVVLFGKWYWEVAKLRLIYNLF